MPELTNLLTFTRAQCLQLLADGDVGRVVFAMGAMPAIQPVNYVLIGHEVFFRTANGAKLAAATRNSVVAFEIDEIDRQDRRGWSVVGVGPCREVTDATELAGATPHLPEPWISDHTGHTIAIELEQISGRRITLAGGITADLYTA
ncbi:MAG TPA: pyridoxamine 5'-phosphate oxidase family protein [Pseudonocardia sp.]|nr:pyridoxamine 5'-phosphate oxidase family protein [Pseudonocardia sp.]